MVTLIINKFGERIFGFYLIGLMLGLIACNGCAEKKTKENPKKVENPRKATGVNFHLDISGSMSGYRTAMIFPRVVSDILGKSSQLALPIENTKIWLAGDTLVLFGDGNKINEFNNSLTFKIDYRENKSSELVKLLSRVADHTKGQNISIFVSDCLPSFPSAHVQKNQGINLISATGPYKTAVNQIFDKLKRKKVAAAVYAYNSDFNGDYYDYFKSPSNISDQEKRPFYIWFLGGQDVLPGFLKDLKSSLSSDNAPDKFLSFGMSSNAIVTKDILSETGRGQNDAWASDEDGLYDFESTGSFAVTIDLASLPAYAQDEKYLLDNLVADAGGKASVKIVDVKRVVNGRTYSSEDEPFIVGKTHIITLRVDGFNSDETILGISLPSRPDDWYKKWSTLDDRTKQGRYEKTFALEPLISGALEAYRKPNEKLIDLQITLKD